MPSMKTIAWIAVVAVCITGIYHYVGKKYMA